MSDKDNPFGSQPSEDPFGSTPGDDPFGREPETPERSFQEGPPPHGPTPPPEPSEAWRQPSTVPYDPFSAPAPAAGVAAPNAQGVVASMVLGILGIVLCPLCAPFAWYYGRRGEQLVDASGGTLSGRGIATAGKVLGMVACGFVILAIVAILVLVAVGSAGGEIGGDATFSLLGNHASGDGLS